MAKFTPKEIDLSQINGGNQFENGDRITPESVNAPIEASAFVQALAKNAPDTSRANLVGTPNVEIITADDGTPRFKFSYLKGATGSSGSSGSNFDLLPIQILGYNGDSYVNEYSFTDIGNGIRRARVLCSIGGTYCSYGGMHILTYSCENPGTGGDLRISVSSIPVHNIDNYSSYSYGDVVEARMDEGFTLSFYVMDSASTYYIPAHDWYVEIEHDTNQNILLVRAFECDNY